LFTAKKKGKNFKQQTMKKTFQILAVFAILGFFVVSPRISPDKSLSELTKNAKDFLAGTFFVDSITEEELRQDYNSAKQGQEKIKILIVPGHDDSVWGTQFGKLKEADMTVDLGEKIYDLFKQEKEFETYIVRNKEGYIQEFDEYFDKEKENIKKFRSEYKGIMDDYLEKGLVKSYELVVHNNATTNVVTTLYGINKWANENDIDVVLHIHFNDYPRRNLRWRGDYSGFSIYVPERQFSNAKASMALAKPVFSQLKKYFAPSDLPKEKDGIIEDQTLIAIGSYNSLDSAVLLVEYGYIYEPKFTNSSVRPIVLQKLAERTFLGINNFFQEQKNDGENIYEDKLSYEWKNNLWKGLRGQEDVFLLQMALATGGFYPPKNFSQNDCPINGNFGYCTNKSAKEFQSFYGIEPVFGYVGPLTRAKLNELYAE